MNLSPSGASRPRVARSTRWPAAPRPPDLGHGSLQLPLHLLHAEGDLRAGLRVPAAGRGPDLRGDRRAARVFVGLGVEKLRLTGGEPLVRRDLPVLVEMLAAIRRPDGGPLDLTLTTNGSALRRLAGPLADAGLQRVTVSLDSLDDAVVRRDERRRVPGRQGPRRDRGRGRGRPRADQDQHGRPARDQRVERPADGPLGARRRRDPAVHRVHGRRPHERLADGRRRPGRGARRPVDAEMPLVAEPPRYRGEVATRYRYADGGGEIGLIASVTRPFCGDCTRARISAEGTSTRVSSPRTATTCGRSCAIPPMSTTRPATPPCATRSPPSGASATTATPSSGPRRRRRPAADRDVRDGWARATIPKVVHSPSTAVQNSWILGPHLGSWWTSPLTRPHPRPTVGLARRGRQEPEKPRSHQGPPLRAGRFGRFVARTRRPRSSPSERRPPDGLRPASRCRYVRRALTEAGLGGRLPPGRSPGGPHARDDSPVDPRARSRRPTSPPASTRSAAAVRARSDLVPRVGIVLGSGLGGLADDLEDPVAIPFAELPGWPAATAPGHVGRLLLGRLGGTPGRDAPGPIPPLRGQRSGARRPARAAVPPARRADRRPDERGRAASTRRSGRGR